MAKIGTKRRAHLIARGLLMERLRKIRYIKEQCLSDATLARRVDSMMSRRAVLTCLLPYAWHSEAASQRPSCQSFTFPPPILCPLHAKPN